MFWEIRGEKCSKGESIQGKKLFEEIQKLFVNSTENECRDSTTGIS